MRSLTEILFSFFLGISFALNSGFALASDSGKRSDSRYKGEIVIPGITDDVTIYRDEKGMPHIYAGNEHDLYLAVGFITAQDRLWQMDLIRRSSTGRLSEIFGKSFLQTDKFARYLALTEKSQMVLKNEDAGILDCLQAYTDGVNAFIKSAGNKKLPLEFRILSYKPEEWKLEDIANIIGFMGWNLTSINLKSELFSYQLVKKVGAEKASQLIPDLKAFTNLSYPDLQIKDTLISDIQSLISSFEKIAGLGVTSFSGSNSWAVSGSRSETGKPMLSNDMHLSLGSPGIWIEMQQVVPGKLNVTGVVIPGQPFVVVGHNEKIAWGMTNLMVDDVDLYAEKINPENQNQYYFNGAWINMKNKSEIIKVRHEQQDTLNIKFTHRGPIISGFSDDEDISLSMRWSGFDYSDEIRSVYILDRAGSWNDFRTGLRTFRSISQNFAYADADGNIGLSAGGGIPVRKGSGIMIRNGETDENDWKGYVPFDQLPFSFNPEKGYVSSANDKTVPDDFPYYAGPEILLPYRINRIRQMLDEKEVFGMEDLKKIINDQHSDFAALMTPYILRLKNRLEELTPEETSALAALDEWDYDMNAHLTAPAIFEFFRISFRKNILADELGGLYDKSAYMIFEPFFYRMLRTGDDAWVDNINTSEKETIDDIVMQSFKDCIKSLGHQCGKKQKKWEWGNVHTITLMHPMGSKKILDCLFNLNSETSGVGGSDHTVSAYFSFNNGFKVDYGASQRHIFNIADWDESLSVLSGGASGMPSSRFYLSQFRTYLDGEFYKDAYSENAVKASACYTLLLKPEK